jgi:hypothetical protein
VFKRLMLIGALVTSVVMILWTEANAQIDGWGVSGYSQLTVEIDLKRVKNPKKDPSILVVSGTLHAAECFCRNPQDKSVTPGEPATEHILGVEVVSERNITKPGAATVTLLFNLDELEEGACNTNWNVVHGSCAADDVTLLMEWFRCTGNPDPTIDPQPCFLDNNPDNLVRANLTVDFTAPIDQVRTRCTLDPLLRDADGIPLHNQVFDCPEIPL